MFGFIRQIFFTRTIFCSCNVLNVNLLKCLSMNNQECKIRTKIIDINNNEPTFYPFSINVNKCSGSCDNINDPYRNYAFLMLLKYKCQSIQSNVKNK